MVKRWFVVFLAVVFASAVALAQRTGGSFGGSRWGSGASVSRPSVSVSRPSVSTWRPSYRPSVVRPVAYRPAAVRPTVSRPASSWPSIFHAAPTRSTHVAVVPIYVGHDHHDEPSAPSEPWTSAEWSILGAVFLIAAVVGGALWWLHRD